ncbi:MAG TPA: DNA polymerase III subunit delta [Rectinemataceae bacterium]|nr:DNA polymerase III subunit delta [Rectinemataceae bacterium]
MKIEPVYILAGPDAGRRTAFVETIRKEFAAATGGAPEEHRLYAQETPVVELLSLAMNGSLFSSARLIEYRDADLAKTKAEVGSLLDYIRRPPKDVVLLLVTSAFGLEKAIEDAVGKDAKKTFWELFENEKPQWLTRRLAESGISIDEEGVETLLELVENDTASLDAACARLAVLFPEGTRLGAEDIDGAIARNRREDAFSLFARMAADEPIWAFECLETVLADRQGGAVPLIAALAWSWKRLLRLHVLMEGGEGFEGACIKSGIRAKSLQATHREALRRYDHRACERVLCLLNDFDARARGGGAQLEAGLLQLLVWGIVVRKGELALDTSYL